MVTVGQKKVEMGNAKNFLQVLDRTGIIVVSVQYGDYAGRIPSPREKVLIRADIVVLYSFI